MAAITPSDAAQLLKSLERAVVNATAAGRMGPGAVRGGGNGRTFYGTPDGKLVAAPSGYHATEAKNGKGLVLLPHGQNLGDNRNIIRWGEPNAQYPQGYLRY